MLETNFESSEIAATESAAKPVVHVVNDSEKTAIIERGTGPTIEVADRCAHHFFEEQAVKNPNATALICGKEKLTFGELNEKANVIGYFLKESGIVPESIVGIGMERSIEAIVCILAVFKSGAAYTIVDPDYPAVRINEILSESKASLLITKLSLKEKFGCAETRIVEYEQFEADGRGNTANVVSSVNVNNAAYVTFTSGSTGKPKGVIGIHLSITTMLDLSKFMYAQNVSTEVGCLLSPLGFGASVGAIFLPLCNGIPLVVIPEGEEKDPYKFACHIGENRITSFVATPALVKLLCSLNDESKKLLQSVKRVGIGGSEITPDLIRSVWQVMPQVRISVGYSGSEIAGAAFGKFIDGEEDIKDERIPLGSQPGPNVQTYILGEDMNILPIGVPGELYVASPYLSRGYIGRPDLTEKRFLRNPFTDSADFNRMYKTGDIMRYRPDGNVEYIGRADSEVKIRGFRVEIEEIESVLRNHPAIEESVVTIDKGKNSERLVAWVVFKSESEADIPELRQHIKKFLPAYMVPSVFIFTKQLPLNANGKVDRMALSFDAAERTTSDYEAPRNQLESSVADIWSSILEQEKIGIHDDFLDLGGDSIQAGLISMKIRECFNVEIPIIMFFEDMTVAILAEEIYHNQENDE
jgi:amino acid adenylation domain-containing protein